jgi:hypothetical protein
LFFAFTQTGGLIAAPGPGYPFSVFRKTTDAHLLIRNGDVHPLAPPQKPTTAAAYGGVMISSIIEDRCAAIPGPNTPFRLWSSV